MEREAVLARTLAPVIPGRPVPVSASREMRSGAPASRRGQAFEERRRSLRQVEDAVRRHDDVATRLAREDDRGPREPSVERRRARRSDLRRTRPRGGPLERRARHFRRHRVDRHARPVRRRRRRRVGAEALVRRPAGRRSAALPRNLLHAPPEKPLPHGRSLRASGNPEETARRIRAVRYRALRRSRVPLSRRSLPRSFVVALALLQAAASLAAEEGDRPPRRRDLPRERAEWTAMLRRDTERRRLGGPPPPRAPAGVRGAGRSSPRPARSRQLHPLRRGPHRACPRERPLVAAARALGGELRNVVGQGRRADHGARRPPFERRGRLRRRGHRRHLEVDRRRDGASAPSPTPPRRSRRARSSSPRPTPTSSTRRRARPTAPTSRETPPPRSGPTSARGSSGASTPARRGAASTSTSPRTRSSRASS